MDSNADTVPIRRTVATATDEDLICLVNTVQEALVGDSNDAEHDALVEVADFLGIYPEAWEAD